MVLTSSALASNGNRNGNKDINIHGKCSNHHNCVASELYAVAILVVTFILLSKVVSSSITKHQHQYASFLDRS